MNSRLVPSHRLRTGGMVLRVFIGGLIRGIAEDPASSPGTPTAESKRLAGDTPTAATREHPFVNSLEMKFIPVVGAPVLFSIWETRVQDFAAFVRETGYQATDGTYSLGTNRWKQGGHTWQAPGFPQTDRNAVCGVSWDDARAFRTWLSQKEGKKYRLPTDLEWSAAVGLPNEPGASPKEPSGKIADVYPWGTEMPPSVNGLPAGNYPGTEASETNWPAGFRIIKGYRDPFERTAPVASFPPNRLGLYDLGGNVWEWCEDEYEPNKDLRTVRGGSWIDNRADNLLSSYRHYGRPGLRNVSIGFRCVLVPEATTNSVPKADK